MNDGKFPRGPIYVFVNGLSSMVKARGSILFIMIPIRSPINKSAVSGQPRLVFLIYRKLKFLILQFIAFSVLETES